MSGAPSVSAAPVPAALGPRVVFFTGGTALRALSQTLTQHTHNSVHLVTPFDSGGSSAALRRAFGMPAVGDIRNRLLALADAAYTPPAVLDVCARRLPAQGDRETLLQELYSLASDKDPAWADVPRVFGEVLRVHLRYFLERMPDSFDPRLASVGNLILAGGYLHHGGSFGPVLGLMARLLHVRGMILPIVNESLHLGAELTDGTLVVGQHRITGNGGSPGPGIDVSEEVARRTLPAPVARLFLTVHEPDSPRAHWTPCLPEVTAMASTYIRAADAICYPMGSFYTSVLANLLPTGVGRAVAEARCPKFYIPNTGPDPEQAYLSVAASVRALLTTLRADAGDVPAERLLGDVLVDMRNGQYPCGVDTEGIEAMGVRVRDMPLIRAEQTQLSVHDPDLTAAAIMDMSSARA